MAIQIFCFYIISPRCSCCICGRTGLLYLCLGTAAGKIGIHIVDQNPGREFPGVTDGRGVAAYIQCLRHYKADVLKLYIPAALPSLRLSQYRLDTPCIFCPNNGLNQIFGGNFCSSQIVSYHTAGFVHNEDHISRLCFQASVELLTV